MEVRTQVRHYRVDLICDNCRMVMYDKNKAEYGQVSVTLTVSPAQFAYQCPGCYTLKFSTEVYPRMETEDIVE